MARIEDHAPSGGRYVDGEERHGYMGRAARITDVVHEPNARFGPRWVVTLAMLDDAEEIALGLADNGYRTRQLGGVMAGLHAGQDFDPVVLYIDEAIEGKPWAFRSATDEEIAAAAAINGADAAAITGPAEVPVDDGEPPKGRRK